MPVILLKTRELVRSNIAPNSTKQLGSFDCNSKTDFPSLHAYSKTVSKSFVDEGKDKISYLSALRAPVGTDSRGKDRLVVLGAARMDAPIEQAPGRAQINKPKAGREAAKSGVQTTTIGAVKLPLVEKVKREPMVEATPPGYQRAQGSAQGAYRQHQRQDFWR